MGKYQLNIRIFKVYFCPELKKLFILIVLTSMYTRSEAQVRHFLDTIRYDLHQPRKLYLGLDGKNSIVSDLSLKMFGLQGGYMYNNRTSFFIGLYTTPRKRTTIVSNPTAHYSQTDSNTVYVSYGLTYLNSGCGYIFYNNKRWQLSANLALGIGSGAYNKYSQSKSYITSRPVIIPFETNINASFKLTWWMWLNAGLGTRIALAGKHDYNGALYTYGFSIKLDAIYRKYMAPGLK